MMTFLHLSKMTINYKRKAYELSRVQTLIWELSPQCFLSTATVKDGCTARSLQTLQTRQFPSGGSQLLKANTVYQMAWSITLSRRVRNDYNLVERLYRNVRKDNKIKPVAYLRAAHCRETFKSSQCTRMYAISRISMSARSPSAKTKICTELLEIDWEPT